jgi:hypothetical protein
MKRYDDFILERMWNGSRKLTKGQFWNLYKENCKDFDVNTKIFKSFQYPLYKENFLIINNIKDRKSSMKGNYYTLMINNMEAWKDYPKRSQICSLNDSWSGNLTGEKAHVVIPFDNSKWGVCDKGDIWWVDFSMSRISNIRELFKYTSIRDDNWNNFLKDLNNISDEDFKKIRKNFSIYFDKDINKKEDVKKFFFDNFKPDLLGFKLCDYKNLDRSSNNRT